MSTPAVVITGLGAASPLGLTATEMWQGLKAGRCGIDTITAFDPAGFDCRIAGQVPDYNIRDYVPRSYRKATKLMCRDIELAVVAAAEAIQDAGLVTKAVDPDRVNIRADRVGINLGAGLISCDLVELAPAVAASISDGRFDIRKWGSRGIELVTPLWLLKYLPNMLACHVGIIHDLQGPSNSITCAEASSQLAIAEAAQVIARGAADVVLAGGAEAKVNPIVFIRQCLLKRVVTDSNDDPAGACRPFAADAAGCVFGEAGGIVVLENAEHAAGRGARIYAELAGTGHSNDLSPDLVHLENNGKALQIAIEKALAEARIEPDQLDLVIPHGTGIPEDDLAEAKAIEAALGGAVENVPVWPTKSMLGNTGAAAGALDVIAAVLTMAEGTIPAAKNCDTRAAGCRLNIVTEPIRKQVQYALCCSYSYGAQTAAVVLKRVDGDSAG